MVVPPARVSLAPVTPRPYWRTRRALMTEGWKHLAGMSFVPALLLVWFGITSLASGEPAVDLAVAVGTYLAVLVILVVVGHLLPTYLRGRLSFGVSLLVTLALLIVAWYLLLGGTDDDAGWIWFYLIAGVLPFVVFTALTRVALPVLRPSCPPDVPVANDPV